MKKSRPVLIFDTNPFNPYGAEIARVISISGRPVFRICRSGQEFKAEGVQDKALLPQASNGQRSIVASSRLALGMARSIVFLVTHRPIVILPWTSSALDTILFRAAKFSSLRCATVVHNPVEGRDEALQDPSVRRVRGSSDALVVHRPGYEKYLSELSSAIAIAPHPSYRSWLRKVRTPTLPIAKRRRTALFVGGTRPDKGFHLLPQIAEALSQRDIGLVVGVGRCSESDIRTLQHPNIQVVGDGRTTLSDNALYVLMRSAGVLIAPYLDVTASGTMLLARTQELPVATFESVAARDLLKEKYLAPLGSITSLVDCTEVALSEKYEWAGSVEDIDTASARAWEEVITRLSLGRVGR